MRSRADMHRHRRCASARAVVKVALACPTVGQTRRGYERFFCDLRRILGPDVDAHLFKGAGAGALRETVVPHFRRTGMLSRLLRQRLAYRRYQLEHASFAAMLAPALIRGAFDVVHVIDPPLAHHLHRLRRIAGLRYRLLYTHGGPALIYPGAGVDHVHCLTEPAREQMRGLGVPANKLSVVPVGLDFQRFQPTGSRATVRAQWEVPMQQTVVLCVGAVNRGHKRIDHLIREMAAAGGDALLWLDGSLHPDGDIGLLALGRDLLGARFRYTEVDSAQVGELYLAADLLVSAAVDESFGMAVVEAMSTGLPVLVHDNPHFQTLLGNAAHRVDMTVPGALSMALQKLLSSIPVASPAQDPRVAVAGLGWPVLRTAYVRLYRQVAGPRDQTTELN
jgi:glycosyltransferase involved in cell wall biosynthesis